MDSEELKKDRYPLLYGLLAQRGLPLQGIYTNRTVARIFEVSARTIQEWRRDGKLHGRDLPGRGKFLSEDLEAFLQGSLKNPDGHNNEEDS